MVINEPSPDCLMTRKSPTAAVMQRPPFSDQSRRRGCVQQTADNVEAEDMNNGVTHKIGIPPVEAIEAGGQLVSKDVKSGTVKNHGEERVAAIST
jgi:hypothetical protein